MYIFSNIYLYIFRNVLSHLSEGLDNEIREEER